MIDWQVCRALLLGFALVLSAEASAQQAGVFALPDGTAKVSASLIVANPPMTGLRTDRILHVSMTKLGDPKPIVSYDLELSKRLHLIAVSADLQNFVHEHAERPDTTGRFDVAMHFPRGGPWHVYADAVPAGLGQQVMRFDVDIGPDDLVALSAPVRQPAGLTGADGRYAVRFDTLALRAGQEADLALHILRDGRPAPDVIPFLGVAAHAVFIDAVDLTYVHVHAAQRAMTHDMAMPGMGGAPMRPDQRLASDLSLHVLAPKAGSYVLWLQFMAGGRVRTVRFVVDVA